MKRFSISREIGGDNAAAIMTAVEAAHAFAREENVSEVLAARLAIVVEELVSNILHHGTPNAVATVDGRMEKAPGGVHLTLCDDGTHFNPKHVLLGKGPHPESGGGSGIPLVRAWSDDLDYRSEAGMNWLELFLRS